MNATRSYTNPAAFVAALTLVLSGAACGYDPVAPEVAAFEPAFLIGSSPLVPVGSPSLEVTGEAPGTVIRKLAVAFKVAAPSQDLARGSLGVRARAEIHEDSKGILVAVLDPAVAAVPSIGTDGGSVALVVIALPIAEAQWAAIVEAASRSECELGVVIEAELLLIAADGSETEIGRAAMAGVVDGKCGATREGSEKS